MSESESKLRKPQLHELLAVLADTNAASEAIRKETYNTLAKKPDHFRGAVKDVVYLNEARAGENTSETKELVTTVHDKLLHMAGIVGHNWDALLQQEEANQRAKADLIVDGVVLMTDVPATFLLGMESRLKAVRDILLIVPTLEPSVTWKAGTLPHTHQANMAASFKTEKTMNSKVLYEATKEHPAEIEKWNEDYTVARVEILVTSGMLTSLRKSMMIDRISKLLTAVKTARMRANCVEVNNQEIGTLMFDYIIGA